MADRERQRLVQLRQRLQSCQSRQRVALVVANELSERTVQLGFIVPIARLEEWNQLRQVTAKLVALLQEGQA